MSYLLAEILNEPMIYNEVCISRRFTGLLGLVGTCHVPVELVAYRLGSLFTGSRSNASQGMLLQCDDSI